MRSRLNPSSINLFFFFDTNVLIAFVIFQRPREPRLGWWRDLTTPMLPFSGQLWLNVERWKFCGWRLRNQTSWHHSLHAITGYLFRDAIKIRTLILSWKIKKALSSQLYQMKMNQIWFNIMKFIYFSKCRSLTLLYLHILWQKIDRNKIQRTITKHCAILYNAWNATGIKII